jgi:hypothetical protein
MTKMGRNKMSGKEPNNRSAATIESLLVSLRTQALANDIDKLGTHQLDAHLSLAYWCKMPPEPWEIYRVPSLHLMPATDFYTRHAAEIQEALKPKATWEFLRLHAEEKLAFDASLTDDEKKGHGYPGKVQYYDIEQKRWISADVPRIRWFDGRELTRETVAQTKDEFRAISDARLVKLQQKVAKEPTSKLHAQLAAQEKYISGQLQENLRKFDNKKKINRAWLAKLDTTRDFFKAILSLLRETENEVRAAMGIAAIGEAWVSETELLYRVRELLPNVEVIAHGQPNWLGRQHIDIWIPAHGIGIEYHGLQHFQSVDFFGGEDAFQRVQERDNRKRDLCMKNGLRLVEIRYDLDVDESTLRMLIANQTVT